MTYETFSLDIDSDGIALVTIDLHGQSMNVWNEALITDFKAFVEELISNDDIKGAVITSGNEIRFPRGCRSQHAWRVGSEQHGRGV